MEDGLLLFGKVEKWKEGMKKGEIIIFYLVPSFSIFLKWEENRRIRSHQHRRFDNLIPLVY
jgi:hypothetical protein